MVDKKKEFKPEEGAEGQVDLTGQQARVNVTHDGGTTKTTYKFKGGEGAVTISDIEYAKRCLPTTNKKGKEKKAEMSLRILVARKLRFPGLTHTPDGPEYVTHIDAFEKEAKTVFKK